jgi:hypothetical protein
VRAVGGDSFDHVVLLVVIGARLIVPPFIPRFPLPAIVAALVIDAADQTIFQQLTNLNLDGYQNYDKALDIYYLTIAFLAVYRNWTNTTAIHVAQFLWYYRLVGVLLFEILQYRWLLFVFPNTFEYFFIAYEAVRTQWDPRRLTRRAVYTTAAFIWIVIKLPQEWWIHIAQNDFTDFMRETIFGVETTTPWSEAVTNRPAVTIALIAATGALIALAVWLYRRLPEPNWSFRFDVDKPIPAVDAPTQPTMTMWPPIAEKLLLIGLVGSIFASALNVDTTWWRIVGATVLLVVVNALVSQALARRGMEWSSLGVEFVVLGLANSALLSVYASLVGDGLNRALTLFFGLLLTVIIVLYDRFRHERETRQPACS